MVSSLCVIALAQNPFISAWVDADLIGKLIFVALVFLSLLSWTILFHKWLVTNRVKAASIRFKRSFFEQKNTPLDIHFSRPSQQETPNAYFLIYEVLKNKTSELMEKNQQAKGEECASSSQKHLLASSDIAFLETHAYSTIATITRYLEKNLYLLSTTVTLAPFLGLLGTVYGILVTFSGMGDGGLAASNAQVLGGISLALTTTVLGLINAIPALIGYSFLKNSINDFDHDMERFSTEVLSTFSMVYRTVDI